MLISIIAAMAENRVIGRNGALPWSISEDLQRFKHLTMGRTLVMGRRTFESIGRPLPGRRTIVVSRNPDYSAAGCRVVTSLAAALQLASAEQEVFICGGAELYAQALPLSGRIYLTEVDISVAGDTLFPEFPGEEFGVIYTETGADEIASNFSVLQRYNCDFPINIGEKYDCT